jgi:hypothetical protein
MVTRISFRPVRFAFALLGFGASVVAGCAGSTGQATGSTCPSGSTLTYENFGQAFMSSYCTACHATREQPTLTTLASIQASREEIDMVAAVGPNAVNTRMPQGGSVPTSERQKLGEWLACGAP